MTQALEYNVNYYTILQYTTTITDTRTRIEGDFCATNFNGRLDGCFKRDTQENYLVTFYVASHICLHP